MAITVIRARAPIGAMVGLQRRRRIANHTDGAAVFFARGRFPGGGLAGIAVWLTDENQSAVCSMRVIGHPDHSGRPCASCGSNASAVHVVMGTAVCALWALGAHVGHSTLLQSTYHMSAATRARDEEPCTCGVEYRGGGDRRNRFPDARRA